jgi:hypothetical protein
MFKVRWEKIAMNALAALWLQAPPLRRKITEATHQIDQQLHTDPLENSESRPDGRRILFVPPLGILHKIEADEQTVSVLRVWGFGKRKQS